MDTNSESDSPDALPPIALPELPRPSSSLVKVDIDALTDRGRVRTTNEDHYLVARAGRVLETLLSNLSENEPSKLFEETAFGIVVADGLGGVAAGEIASRQAIYTLLTLALHTPDWHFIWGAKEENTVMWRMKARFVQVNEALLQQAAAHTGLTGMSTTMTAVVSYGNTIIVTHVGDSRAYLMHRGKLQRLTRDHTLAQRLIDSGIIAPEDDLARGLRSVLMQALGSQQSECLPDVRRYSLEDGDQLLLCTDGLTDMVEEDSIESILTKESSPKAACRALVDSALSNGGRDNVTVVVARYSFPSQIV